MKSFQFLPFIPSNILLNTIAAYNAYLFPMNELVEQSTKGEDILCPVHKEAVPLKLLVSI